MVGEGPTAGTDYPWYSVVSESGIEQGDFYVRFPVIVPVYPEQGLVPNGSARASVQVFDAVVLSQSCDLKHGKCDNVLMCPVYGLSRAKETLRSLGDKRSRDEVRQGKRPALHMLEACYLSGFESEVRVVNFAQVFTVPFAYAVAVARQAPNRLRLMPPYREHLSQAFARFVMRVGLPQDIVVRDE